LSYTDSKNKISKIDEISQKTFISVNFVDIFIP